MQDSYLFSRCLHFFICELQGVLLEFYIYNFMHSCFFLGKVRNQNFKQSEVSEIWIFLKFGEVPLNPQWTSVKIFNTIYDPLDILFYF